MGSACSFCKASPNSSKLVKFDCGHHVCHECVKANAKFLENGNAVMTCNNCGQLTQGSTQNITPQPLEFRIKYGNLFYNFNIDTAPTTRALTIKKEFVKKINKQALIFTKLKQSDFMLRVINEGYVFEQHFVFQIRKDRLNLEIGMHPEAESANCRRPAS